MAYEFSGYFDSVPGDERPYTDAELSQGFRVIQDEGVKSLESNLRVVPAESGLRVRVDYGSALVRGYPYELVDDGGSVFYLDFTLASGNPRIDRVVLRLDLNTGARNIRLMVLQGEEAAGPVPPALTREGSIYEISLAQVRVNLGASMIVEGNITDERAEEAVCGVLDKALRAADAAQETADAAQETANAAKGVANAALPASSYTAADVLAKIKTADGAGSGLDADLLDGQQGVYYATQAALNAVNAKTAAGIPATVYPSGTAASVQEVLDALWVTVNYVRSLVDGAAIQNQVWPVGSIFLTLNAVNPAYLVAGSTWVRIAYGRTLIGVNENDSDFNVAGKMGGQKQVPLMLNNLPSYQPELQSSIDGGQTWRTGAQFGRAGGGYTSDTYFSVGANIEAFANWMGRVAPVGGDVPHNNVPEYLAVYIWQRVA